MVTYRLKNNTTGSGVVVDPEARLEEELIVRLETIIWNATKGGYNHGATCRHTAAN